MITARTPSSTDTRGVVGIVGLGKIGGGIARGAMDGGFKVVVFDVRRDAVDELVALGASAATSIVDLARQASTIAVVVVTVDQAATVLDKIIAAQVDGITVLVHSTLPPASVVALSERAAAAGIEFIDAPVSGGRERAIRGSLTVIVGGPADSIERCWTYLEAIGTHLRRVGPVGAAQAVKLANNVLSIGGYSLQLEAMKLARAYGVSEDDVTTAVAVSQGDSRGIRTWGRMDNALRQSAQAGNPSGMVKDLRLAVLAASEAGEDLPLVGWISESMPDQLDARLEQLASDIHREPIPLCILCGQELAAPFREVGVHPECSSGRLAR